MASGRFLSISIAEDDRLSRLSLIAEYVYLKAIPHLDRDGLVTGKPGLLYSRVCPTREELFGGLQAIIDEWVAVGLVVRFTSPEGPALFFVGFSKNNNLPHYERERPSRFPPPPGYYRTDKGMFPDGTLPPEKKSKKAKDDSLPESGESDNSILDEVQELLQDSVPILGTEEEEQEEDKDQDKDQGRERAPARIASPREPASKEIRFKSPHVDLRHFVNGYVPPGKGTNAVEVYYERFSIHQDVARLNAIKEDDLATFCKDLEKLREVVIAYSRTAFQLGNVALILDWYRDGVPEKHRPPSMNGVYKNNNSTDEERTRKQARARQAREKIKTAELTRMPIDPQWLKDIEAAR